MDEVGGVSANISFSFSSALWIFHGLTLKHSLGVYAVC